MDTIQWIWKIWEALWRKMKVKVKEFKKKAFYKCRNWQNSWKKFKCWGRLNNKEECRSKSVNSYLKSVWKWRMKRTSSRHRSYKIETSMRHNRKRSLRCKNCWSSLKEISLNHQMFTVNIITSGKIWPAQVAIIVLLIPHFSQILITILLTINCKCLWRRRKILIASRYQKSVKMKTNHRLSTMTKIIPNRKNTNIVIFSNPNNLNIMDHPRISSDKKSNHQPKCHPKII